VETVLKSIIDLGREMKMRVTVEGVETERQVDFLYNAHADQVQGFYFGEPLPASELGADVLKDFRTSLGVDNRSKVKRGAQMGETQSALAAKLHNRTI
jgi:predicted signal transduction protein with EAL and GGDEF domain